jgi:hypothetical protein
MFFSSKQNFAEFAAVENRDGAANVATYIVNKDSLPNPLSRLEFPNKTGN